MESRFIVMTKRGSDGTSRCAEIRALTMVIGFTGPNGVVISQAYLNELLSYSKDRPESALIVDCTSGQRTNHKSTTSSPDKQGENMATTIGNSSTLIVTTGKPPKRNDYGD
jgi:hypothetical protein